MKKGLLIQPLNKTLTLAYQYAVALICYLALPSAFAEPAKGALSVWVSEAVISAYTFSDKTLIEDQRLLAKYFSAQGWINFSKALDSAKLKDSVLQNHYSVSALADAPPEIQKLSDRNEWQATMPITVFYKNPEHQQKQNLSVSITFGPVSGDAGVRGFAISSFESKISSDFCICQNASAGTARE